MAPWRHLHLQELGGILGPKFTINPGWFFVKRWVIYILLYIKLFFDRTDINVLILCYCMTICIALLSSLMPCLY